MHVRVDEALVQMLRDKFLQFTILFYSHCQLDRVNSVIFPSFVSSHVVMKRASKTEVKNNTKQTEKNEAKARDPREIITYRIDLEGTNTAPLLYYFSNSLQVWHN